MSTLVNVQVFCTNQSVLIMIITNKNIEKQRGTRRYIPEFTEAMVSHPTARRLNAALEQHDWSRNRYIAKLRQEGAELKRSKFDKDLNKKVSITKIIAPRRKTIRIERDQTFTELTKAMIYRADYDPDAPFLFEVNASVEELARLIGQLHEYEPGYDGEHGQYRCGRKACDPVHAAIDDWEAAKMLIVVREFDKKAGTYKASRIFFRPEFFKSLGFTMEDTKAMIRTARKWQQKKGLVNKAKQKRQAELLRKTKHERLAQLNSYGLKNLLTRFKREFTGDDKHTESVQKAHNEIKSEIAARKKIKQEQPQRTATETELMRIKSTLPFFMLAEAEKQVTTEFGINKPEPQFDEKLLIILKNKLPS